LEGTFEGNFEDAVGPFDGSGVGDIVVAAEVDKTILGSVEGKFVG